jgi:hypothetical protein
MLNEVRSGKDRLVQVWTSYAWFGLVGLFISD